MLHPADDAFNMPPVQTNAAPPGCAAPAAPRRVLLVDDEAHILRILSVKLEAAGYDVHTCGNGRLGLAEAVAWRPDLIVTDLTMPLMNGVEFSRALHADARLRDVPVIMLTSRSHAVDPELRELGNVRRFVSKPFSARELTAEVGRTLNA